MMKRSFENTGVCIPEILLPSEAVDLHKWSVIACDQYTSQPDYWKAVEKKAAGSPSAFNLVFPEIYLKDDDREVRIENINETMDRYLDQGILKPQEPGFILTDRRTPHASSRKGLILAVDLECYDYSPGAKTLIRATEGTVLDRIPPRVKIRENAAIELPHIMLLIDDPERTLIEKLYEKRDRFRKLYDFELMQGGGHLTGWKIDDDESLDFVSEALKKLMDGYCDTSTASFADSVTGDGSSSRLTAIERDKEPSPVRPLLFAAGDGNHSLATAKAHWENVKAGLGGQAAAEQPARYALVEVVNVHDEGLVFEPIHRVVFGIDGTRILEDMKNAAERGDYPSIGYKMFDSKQAMEAALPRAKRQEDAHIIPFILEGAFGLITVEKPSYGLEVGTLQSLLDELAKGSGHMEIDYIHGGDVVTELGTRKGCMGFYLPVMDKRDLFRTVIKDGVLPRKTFSMGEAEEKRYYLECRKIR